MSRITIAQLRKMGFSDEDIELAKATRDAQISQGLRPHSLAAICGAVPTRMNDHALRRRSSYEQAALLLDQQAMLEPDFKRATQAREASRKAKRLASPKQGEWDFFGGGNMSTGHEFYDAVTERLAALDITPAQQGLAEATMMRIGRNLKWESYECEWTASDLARAARLDEARMSRILKILEDVGAIYRVRLHREKVIVVNPEGMFRGNINKHRDIAADFRLRVIEGGNAA